MIYDLRHALRRLRGSPGFTITAVASLALALGATIALFTIVDAVLLRPLAYPEADRLVAVRNRVDGISPSPWGLSQAQYFDFQRHAASFEGIGVYATSEFAFADSDGAERVPAALVSASLLDVLRARPALGRLIRDDETRSGPSSVAMLGHDFWVRQFGADPHVIGRSLRIESRSVEVVGVLPRGFDLPDRNTAVWLALPLDPTARPVNSHFLEAIARLTPDASVDRARVDLERLVARFPDIFPEAYGPAFMRESRFAPEVIPLHDTVVGGARRTLWILFGAAGLVLLIACANVANLFLVRMEDRRHEVEIRAALGAEARHLARQYVAEALVLTLAAGALGLVMADAALGALLASDPAGLPRLDQIALGWRGVRFTAALSSAAGVALGLMPILRRHIGGTALWQGHRAMTSARGTIRTRNALVVSQIALTVVLLASGGLMARSFDNLGRVDPGFDPAGVLAAGVSLPAVRYTTYQQTSAFYEALLGRVRALPGVASAGATTSLPLAGGAGCAVLFVEDSPLTPGEMPPCLPVRRVAPGYFEAMRIPVRGESPGWSETNAATAGAVVTRALGARLWPDDDPIGKGIRGAGWARPFYRVVGVAEDVREAGLNQPPVEAVYFPLIPLEGAPLWGPPRAMTVVLRVQSGSPETLAPAMRRVMNELDPAVPLGSIRTMTSVVDRSMARTTLAMVLLGIGAALALLLGTIGLYGVLAYTVGRKQREIGIRMALGSGRSEVASLVVRQSVVLIAAGLVLGILAAALTTRVLENLLFGVSPGDPLTFTAACIVLAATGLMASYIPARRAASVDPIVVLRVE